MITAITTLTVANTAYLPHLPRGPVDDLLRSIYRSLLTPAARGRDRRCRVVATSASGGRRHAAFECGRTRALVRFGVAAGAGGGEAAIAFAGGAA